ncbi:F5/8 type C domain-containing protein [Paenibacillus sp. UNCCL117]|uniref:CehA/McbA family metallohydrolase n=1 Tax=unclassified Paenibacillus TaxID=185978 RepID=UPI0008910D4D|nr:MULTISPECIES: CehA/McbA family metallohydrolase [unclassified Paenibacillus]SDC15256.1 F5/8 type C domain-containing protein [Paenibacillus sp. cl123]SFW17505.1 F5/8 type C domain-containing protein [Paenibacillus sp. UNCCL117]
MTENISNEQVRQLPLVSEGKTATAESELEGFEAGKAIDGRPDTSWAGAPYYQWWKLDLHQACLIEQIRLETESGEGGHYSLYFIEASMDDLNWTTVAEKTAESPSQPGGKRYDLSIEARYLKVTITYSSSGDTAAIRRFEAYGQPAAEPASPPRHPASGKIRAADCDEQRGFALQEVDELENGRIDRVLVSGEAGSYVAFRGLDFTESGVDQLRGEFGFTNLDKEKKVRLEVRVDGLQGEKIGELVLFKQWKRWSILGGKLEHADRSLLTGMHDVYLIIKEAAPEQSLMIHWIAAVRKSPLPAPKPRSRALPAPADGEYRIYFGNLHSHTAFSDGIGTPEYAYDYARYTAGLDFLAITEHSNLYDHYLDWDRSRKWADIQRMADKKTEDGAFLALFGAETTWYNQFGHMNTYNMDCFINTYETDFNDIPHYYNTVKQYPDSIHQWNHPWSCGNRHLDGFDPYDAELDEVLHLVEIKPAESSELGGLYYYVLALDKGWHIAPAGNQDNHHGQWGTENTLRTAVLVDKLTREDFFDAVRHQRVYFTSALHLKVWFRVNGAIMGSRIRRTDTLQFDIKALYGAETGGRIVKAEIIGEQGRVVHTFEHEGAELEWKVELPCEDRYYFVKVYQHDDEFAATAPIWIEEA